MSKFEYGCFYGNGDSLGFNASKYSKEEVLKIIKESEQQLMPEEITAKTNKRYGQVLPVQVTLTFMVRGIYGY